MNPYLAHLRLPFQLLLAPLFLWGFLLAGGAPTVSAAVAFVSLHLFLYPGATAFNSAIDRDEGPVSGLGTPPTVPRHLLGFALALQGAGAVLAAGVNPPFLFLYLALAGVFFGYSHPAARWKASPVASALAVGLGQGGLGFALGWAAGTGSLPPLSLDAVVGGCVAALTALGLYPSTQIFQVAEDRARGDRTLAVALGPAGALRLGALCLSLAGAGAAYVAVARFGGLDAVLLFVGYLFLVVRHLRFAGVIEAAAPTGEGRFAWATDTRRITAAGFLAWLAFKLSGL